MILRVFTSTLLTVMLALSAFFAEGAKAPNIIVIFVDDMGYGDLGSFGATDIQTPHLDNMALQGMRFKSFYAASVCGPSRAQLMTGSYAVRTGSDHNELPASNTGLNLSEVTIAEILQGAGYKTMHIGKWHLGDAPEFLPTRQGFDAFWGFPYSHDMWPYHPFSSAKTIAKVQDKALMAKMLKRKEALHYTARDGQWEFPDLPLYNGERVIETNPEQSQMTRRYTEQALRFIEANASQPFFLYLAHTMPHTPLFVSDKFNGKSARGLYGDAVMEVDWSYGQIIKKLKELNIDEHTLVIFTSDNGPTTKYGTDGGSAGPLRGGKGSLFEGGVRVPAIFRWPSMIPAGAETTAMAGTIDLLPTFAHLANTQLPTDRVIDGKNITPLLLGQSNVSPHQYMHYLSPGRDKKTIAMKYRAIRNQKWKLLVKAQSADKLQALALYDMQADISEQHNLLEQQAQVATQLTRAASEFIEEIERNKRPMGVLAK